MAMHASETMPRIDRSLNLMLDAERSPQHRHGIADAQDAFTARDQVLTERDALGRAAIFDQRAQRFAAGVECARGKIDGREYATDARFDDVEFDAADADALPSVFGVRLGAFDKQIRPKPQGGNGRLQSFVQIVP